MDFKEFPKMARLSRPCVVTEKIDGTNACVFIAPGSPDTPNAIHTWRDEDAVTDMVMLAGSRTRWITPEDDNFGFARWVLNNREALKQLGPGQHFGEWWGSGIRRGYGLPKGEKRFSLFNTSRWSDVTVRPGCCDVVPVLWMGDFSRLNSEELIAQLAERGSLAAPGFMKPEGIVAFHLAGGVGFKKTIEKDEVPKGMVNHA
jgi:hypothetical protein